MFKRLTWICTNALLLAFSNSVFCESIIDTESKTLDQIVRDCETSLSCAGVMSRKADNGETLLLPSSIIREDQLHQKVVYRSSRAFVLRRGEKAFVENQKEVILEASEMTLTEAKDFCQQHPECIAFSFPVFSKNLAHLERIVFVSAVHELVQSFVHDEWTTYLANDRDKDYRIQLDTNNHETAFLLEESKKVGSCCAKDLNDLPSIEEVQLVDTLERIPCTISSQEFEEKYEKTRTPVILTGCGEDWPAHERWTKDAFLSDTFENTRFLTSWGGDRSGINNRGKTGRELYEATQQDVGFYAFHPIEGDTSSILEDFSVPSPFQGRDSFQYLDNFPRGYGPDQFICWGTKHSGTRIHLDHLETDAWKTVTQGAKWWVMYPHGAYTKDSVDLLRCNTDCSGGGTSDFSGAKEWYTNIGRNALWDEQPKGFPIHILQQANETIYIPSGVAHSVLNMASPTISITENYASPVHYKAVFGEVIKEGDMEDARQFFTRALQDDSQRNIIRSLYGTGDWESPTTSSTRDA